MIVLSTHPGDPNGFFGGMNRELSVEVSSLTYAEMTAKDQSESLMGTRPENRPLTDAERALLEWLIAHGTPEAQEYASQVPQVLVVARCTCGCPTIDLAIGDRQHRTFGGSQVLADFEGVTPEGTEVGVILHAREGQLSELEVYAVPKVDGRFSLPRIDSLK